MAGIFMFSSERIDRVDNDKLCYYCQCNLYSMIELQTGVCDICDMEFEDDDDDDEAEEFWDEFGQGGW